uniref:Uncharacterized protein n=1 Tax=Arundo donax TaxID=35708 RepID=A0A0A9H6H1_ARUDO
MISSLVQENNGLSYASHTNLISITDVICCGKINGL